jgi:hypothetical protein
MASASNNLFITVNEKLYSQQIEKGDAVSILQDPFPRNLPGKKNPNH